LAGIGVATALAFVISSSGYPLCKGCPGYDGRAAEGDLTVRGHIKGKDELAQLADSFNGFMERIQAMTRDIHDTTITLTKSSGRLIGISEAYGG